MCKTQQRHSADVMAVMVALSKTTPPTEVLHALYGRTDVLNFIPTAMHHNNVKAIYIMVHGLVTSSHTSTEA